MYRSPTPWYVLALALPIAACSGDDDGPTAANLFDGFTNGSVSVPARIAITTLLPLNPAATITGYTISPTLPEGLTFDTQTGAISGTPIDTSIAQVFTVTASDDTDSDSELISITVRNPMVDLTIDRRLTVVENIVGTPIAPEGAGPGLTGSAPVASLATLTETEMPATAAASVAAANDTSNVSADLAPDANDATVDFIATVTIDDSELASTDTWTFAAQEPYDGLAAPTLPSFAVDTSVVMVEDGDLTLDVSFDDGVTTIGPFDSGSLATDVRAVEPLTGTASLVGLTWTPLAGDFYTEVTNGAGETEVFRFDADGAVGGGPILEEAFDLDDSVDGDAQIQGTVNGQLIVQMNDASTTSAKTFAYDPIADTLAQIADLNPAGDDSNSLFTELDGVLYFVGTDDMSMESIYRYDDSVDPATLEIVSSTNTNGSDAPEGLAVFLGDLYFTAADDAGARRLFRFDPATDTQELLSDVALSDVDNLIVAGGFLYATALSAGGGEKLFIFDETADALRQVSDLTDDDSLDDSISPRQAFQGQMYFVGNDGASGDKLYRHNPNALPETIEQVSNTAGTGNNDNAFAMTPMGELLFFGADNGMAASKLWVFNSVDGEISQVTDINGLGTNDLPNDMTPIGTTRLAFSALSGATDRELFIYSLATGETLRAADVNDSASDNASPIVEFGGRVVFRAENSTGFAFYAAD